MSQDTFTGLRRTRATRTSVKVADMTARTLITVGGIGTIIAVLLICVFLVWVVLPIFSGGGLENEVALTGESSGRILRLGLDEYRTLAWAYRADGKITVRRMDTGEEMETRSLFPERLPTAQAFVVGSNQAIFGFEDGSIRLGEFEFATAFRSLEQVSSEEADRLRAGDLVSLDGGLAKLSPEGQVRVQKLVSKVEAPTDLGVSSPIVRLDYSIRPRGPEFAALTQDGTLLLKEGRAHPLTKKIRFQAGAGATFPAPVPSGKGLPDHLLLNGLGTNLFLIWNDGLLVRLNTGDLEDIREPERIHVLPADGSKISTVAWLNGKATLLVGDDRGRTHIWFTAKPETAETTDGQILVRAGMFEGPPAPVTAIAPSWRTRIASIGYGDGSVRLYHVTTGRLVGEGRVASDEVPGALAIAPKEDGLLAATAVGIWSWDLDAEHADVTLHSLFFPVHYEGYAEPMHKWQSTGGTDDAEPKLGLLPLVFGTLKATFYSMLFGLPLALLAAVFASEFLHPRAKSRIKPTIEVMASLPSVVLGFLAALVIAPFLADRVAETLTVFLTLPYTVLLGAHLWQLLPSERALRYRRLRLPLIALTIPVGILLAGALGPAVEAGLFGGDIRAWLDGAGGGFGGWFFLLLPVAALIITILMARFVGPFLRAVAADWDRNSAALLDLAKFFGAILLTAGIAAVLGVALDALGFDPRGSLVGTYVQRNALIVGFVMGFAIIPIIFTIADDALSAVPEHLRSASLGAGATTWQTAIRIVIPTAMSGLFSAVMIGLGRAVGETMIVLMAAGNTPIMEWNIFNGFRTLSANLATELPEAVVGSTHYRVLFLAALVLFLMTFIVNTIAEVVRMRFRKRAFEL